MEGRGIGRGVGRGIGRGLAPAAPPPEAASPAPVTPEKPTAVPVIGRGRGITLASAVAAPVSPATTSVISEPQPVAGRGVGRGAVPRAGGDTATIPAQTQAPAASRTTSTIQQAAERLERLQVAPQARRGHVEMEIPPHLAARERETLEQQQARRAKELEFIEKPVGQQGKSVDLMTNAVHFTASPDAWVHEYRVDFYPQTWNPRLRVKLIEKIKEQFGGPYLFDNDNLYLSNQLPRQEMEFSVESPYSQGPTYRLVMRHVMSNKANESKELLNLITKEVEIAMQFTQIGKNRYDGAKRVAIKEQNVPAMEIWPGYQTSVNPYAAGVLMVVDAAFRVVRVDTVKQHLDQWRQKAGSRPDAYQRSARDYLLGTTVLTTHNKRSYVVSEIAFDKTPLDTFDTVNGPITYVEYYEKQYNYKIQDLKQPLLFSKPSPTGAKRKQNKMVALIPELCLMTGIQDDLRANFYAMKAITTTTKLDPKARVGEFIEKYMDAFMKNQQAQDLMRSWGISVGRELLKIPGRQLPAESIQFDLKRPPVTVAENGDWTRDATRKMLSPRNLRNWTMIFQARDEAKASEFFGTLKQVGSNLGMQVEDPEIIRLTADTTIQYTGSVAQAVNNKKAEMVVLIFPTPRDDRYAAVKKECYVVHGVASQCINLKTLSRPDRLQAIVQKIALQMNCKLGGYLWRMGALKLPEKVDVEPMRLMVVGLDAYHDLKRQRDSVTAMVTSLDEDFTQWHSRCNFQSAKAELSTGLSISFASSLNAYVKRNKTLPNTIVIFRDGLSDAEVNFAVTQELPQIMDVCRNPNAIFEQLHSGSESTSGSESGSSLEADYHPEIYFIIVQKRISQRLFLLSKDSKGGRALSNPKPGTVCDQMITRRDMYDFYLVPQNVREGSVAPVHFIVCHQPQKPRLSVDNIQSLAYKLTHMYYNWSGSVRVPAPCMYAHKLAYQSGACYDRTEPNLSMADKLFYL